MMRRESVVASTPTMPLAAIKMAPPMDATPAPTMTAAQQQVPSAKPSAAASGASTTTKLVPGGGSSGSGAVARIGRGAAELRQMYVKTGTVTQASGSAFISLSGTKVLCSVHGPRPLPTITGDAVSELGIIKCEFRVARFAELGVRRGGEKFSEERSEEKELGLLLAQSLEVAVCLRSFPKSIVDVNILVVEDDGSVLSAACIAASLALADAGIEMYDLVTACTVSKSPSGTLLVDPDHKEEQNQKGGLMLSYTPSIGEITQMCLFGQLSQADINDSIAMCIDACTKLSALMSEVLASTISNNRTE
ncbi:Exosome complex component MTR3 [Pelomyxa schiedti]|nr:Exosome complex component MTR3 [Pelomyxa schiedti]